MVLSATWKRADPHGRGSCPLLFVPMRLSAGKREDKLRANSLCTDDIDIFVVCLDDLFYDGKTQTGALFVLTTGKVTLIEAFPYPVEIFFRDTDAIVPYGHEDFFPTFCCLNCDRGIWVAELDSIIQKVVEYLLDFSPVSVNIQYLGCQKQLDGDLPFRAGTFK